MPGVVASHTCTRATLAGGHPATRTRATDYHTGSFATTLQLGTATATAGGDATAPPLPLSAGRNRWRSSNAARTHHHVLAPCLPTCITMPR
jgi:hypothetical protein